MPLGVTVHVNEDDGDVNVQGPSSLQVISVEPGSSSPFLSSICTLMCFLYSYCLCLCSGGWIFIHFLPMKINQ